MRNMIFRFPLYFKFTFVLIGISLLVYGIMATATILIPLVWSLFIALIILPMTRYLENRGWNRVVAIILPMLLITLVLGSLFYFLSTQVVGLVSDIPTLTRKVNLYYQEVGLYIFDKFNIPFEQQPRRISNAFSSFIESRMGLIGDTVAHTGTTIAMIGIMPVFIFLFLYDRDFFVAFIEKLYKKKRANQILSLVSKTSDVVQSYLSGVLWVTLIVAVLVSIVFFLLGVKYALFFALFVAVFNLIPYVGVFIASVVSVLYVFLTTDSILYPIFTLVLLWSVQLVENNLITPYIVGSKVNLNPLVVILAILIGGSIWGVSGMVLFIPLTGALKVIFDEIESMQPYGHLLGERQ